MNKYEVIIIGAGLGGLTAGATLAKAGKKVLILEQGKAIGGCAATFNRRGYTIESSLHEIDGCDAIGPKSSLFSELRIAENVGFLRIPQFYRFVNQRIDIEIPDDPIAAQKKISSYFPKERAGIKKFFETIIEIRKEALQYGKTKQHLLKYYKTSLGDFLDSIINDEDAKLALLANLQFYNDDPYALPLVNFAIAQGSYYSGGCYYIRGGSSSLTSYLAKLIKEFGGEIRLGCMAKDIHMIDEESFSITYEEARGESSEDKELETRCIIANANIPDVINKLLTNFSKEKIVALAQSPPLSISITSIYICFKKPPKEFGNKCFATYVFSSDIKKLRQLVDNFRGDPLKRIYSFIDYCQVSSSQPALQKEVGTICLIDYFKGWATLSENDYKLRKDSIASCFIDRLNRLIPNIRDGIEYYEVATPKTINRLTLNPSGACYGYAPSFRKRPSQKSSIKNLYFASAWTKPGGSFSGAMLSGYFCAKSILDQEQK